MQAKSIAVLRLVQNIADSLWLHCAVIVYSFEELFLCRSNEELQKSTCIMLHVA